MPPPAPRDTETIDVRAERIQFLGGSPRGEGQASASGESVAKDVNEPDVISPEDIAWEE